jgi:hypothetical protein
MDNDNVVEGPWSEGEEKDAVDGLREDIEKIKNNQPLPNESPAEYRKRVFGEEDASETPAVEPVPWSCKACGYESKKDERVLSLNMGDAFQVTQCNYPILSMMNLRK